MSQDGVRRGESSSKVLEFKGRMMSLTVLRLLSVDTEAIASALAERCQTAPQLFRNLPVLIDVDGCDPTTPPDLAALLARVREQGLLPIGLHGDSGRWRAAAQQVGVSFFAADAARAHAPAPASAPAAAPPASAPVRPDPAAARAAGRESARRDADDLAPMASLVVEHTVRSGQQVFSPTGDLIVIGDVGAGAEVLAAGNVHVYGTLRGKALAGVFGDRRGRIFCRRFDAEMVSVAGVYAVTDQFGRDVVGQPALISLEPGAERLAIKRI
jgi:septum site-determining protein MinC